MATATETKTLHADFTKPPPPGYKVAKPLSNVRSTPVITNLDPSHHYGDFRDGMFHLLSQSCQFCRSDQRLTLVLIVLRRSPSRWLRGHQGSCSS